jgi:hypothetical protein
MRHLRAVTPLFSSRALLAAALTAACLPACTTEQVYSTGKEYQRSLCSRILEPAEYERCMRDADFAYDEYMRRKQEEEAQKH